ncbi:M10 family metallopeptidase [Geminicoccus harenae]|uniref:M10 family metallopeptidase n=1 Tax=Geminicoccus harenae TaxID=2498453 RepID=UPI00168A6511|nr:M10 family metallopeptidase [Geminicoccus harenae]
MAQTLGAVHPGAFTPFTFILDQVDPAARVRNALLGGTRLGTDEAGNGLVVSYSFAGPGSTWSAEYDGSVDAANVVTMGNAQRAAIRAALDHIEQFVDVRFVPVADGAASVGVLRFAQSESAGGAYRFLPHESPAAGDIWLPWWFGTPEVDLLPGGSDYMTVLHEIGHALGLTHPHDSSPAMVPGEDWLGGTLMSYRVFPGDVPASGSWPFVFPDGLSAYDVDALRFLYGARAHATGDDVYRFEQDPMMLTTLVDDGGTDLLDLSNQVADVQVDLRQGNWSLVGWEYGWLDPAGNYAELPRSLRTAFGTIIENANGGSGNDHITGNGADNVLAGFDGADMLLGLGGNDRLLGLGGSDQLFGEAGADLLNGGSLADVLDGGAGNDEMFGADGRDRLGGGAGDDIAHGGSANDILAGGAGDDVLGGGADDDLLNGGVGDDVLTGGTGRDRFVLEADAGSSDRITDFSAGIDQILLRGGYSVDQFLAAATTSGGNTSFALANGHDVLLVGATGVRADWFTTT